MTPDAPSASPSSHHRPRRRFGQHFLAAPWAEKVVHAIDPRPGDVFLEVGPGTGAITLPLAERGVPILAVEIDRDLSRDLAERVPPNVTIVTSDFLTADVVPYLTGLEPQRTPAAEHTAAPRRLRVVGNLPYNLSTPILFRLIDLHLSDRLFADATIMLQREVAERLVAKPGTKAYGTLSIHAQLHADIAIILRLPPGAFRPAPKVDSAVVSLTFREPSVRIVDFKLFDRLIKTLFSARRKTLANGLKSFDPASGIVLSLSKIDPKRRPETLSLAEFARLVELFATARLPPRS